MERMAMAELLAPAGSIEGLSAVIAAGADAVYIGGAKFGARAYAENPAEDDLLRGIDYAHLRGVRVYLTVNTLLKEKEMEDLYDFILPYYRQGIDAVLVQDFGVLRFLHRAFPDLPLHASTQMTITGPKMSRLLKDMGVTRVVPAREMTFEELKAIKSTGLEVETFIHGALCVCYSGQCLMSSMIGGRSGNRGRCAQPCRMLFLMDDKTEYNGKPVITTRKEARHFISPKDLNGIDMLPALYSMGIDSFKIEGRMKRPEYAAGVVAVYRRYLDQLLEGKPYKVTDEDRKILYDLYNRSGFTDGYFTRHNGPEMMAPIKHELTHKETDARHDLYEEMHRRYMDEEKKVPVSGTAFIYVGQPSSLTFYDENVTATVTGADAEEAKKQPLAENDIQASLTKTGGTDFCVEALDIITDGRSFLPKSALNELRRNGLCSLKEAMLSGYTRHAEKSLSPCKKKEDDSPEKKHTPSVSALVSTEEQLRAALSISEGLTRIYVESYLVHGQDEAAETLALVKRAQEAGKQLFIALPYITRSGSEESTLMRAAPDLIAHGLGGFLVRSTEDFAWAKEVGIEKYVRTDAGLYTYNTEAKEFLRDLGTACDTAPVELNKNELRHRENSGSELVVYGRMPLMVSAQCLEKTTNRCTKSWPCHVLTDRMGMKFPVKSICDFCYTVLYNSLPLSLLGEMQSLATMGFDGFRAAFTSESEKETREILRILTQNVLKGQQEEIQMPYTRGHFQRGVE